MKAGVSSPPDFVRDAVETASRVEAGATEDVVRGSEAESRIARVYEVMRALYDDGGHRNFVDIVVRRGKARVKSLVYTPVTAILVSGRFVGRN